MPLFLPAAGIKCFSVVGPCSRILSERSSRSQTVTRTSWATQWVGPGCRWFLSQRPSLSTVGAGEVCGSSFHYQRAPPPMVIQAHARRTMHTCPETGMNMHLETPAHRHTYRHTHKTAQKCRCTQSPPTQMHTQGPVCSCTVTNLTTISHSAELQAKVLPWKDMRGGDGMRQG